MNRSLEGKIVAISGGTASVGKEIVLALAKEGANIVLLTHNQKAAEELILEIDKLGTKSIYVSCEITSEDQFAEMIDAVIEKFGRLDIAINNAGFGPMAKGYSMQTVDEITGESWDRYMDNGLKGIFFSMKHELKQMKKQGHGVIINTALEGLAPKACTSLYAVAKAGTMALTKSAAMENKDNNIRINMVYCEPDNFDKDRNDKAIAGLICSLCEDAAYSISGNIITADFSKNE